MEATAIAKSPSPSNAHSPSLITIPTTILANILSYTSKKQREIIQICSCHPSLWEQHNVCHRSRSTNNLNDNDNDENLWRYLCHLSFPCSKECMSHWPSPSQSASWMAIYAILEEWIPKEGFYNILDANPWGMIVLLHFYKGDIIGEILWHNDDDADSSDNDEKEKATLHEFIKISNFHHQNGKLASSSGTLFNKVPIQISPVKDRDNAVLSGALTFPEITRGGPFTFLAQIFSGLSPYPSTDALCIAPLDMDEQMEEEANENEQQHHEEETVTGLNADPWNPFNTHSSIPDMVYKLWNAMKDTSNPSLVLDSVKLPSMSVYNHLLSSSPLPTSTTASSSSSTSVPFIKPGLYSGSYDNTLYGKFSREVALIEYAKYSLTPHSNNGQTWKEIHQTIFRAEKQRDDASLFKSLLTLMLSKYASSEEIIFVFGKKVTGDIHVSAGEISWGAVVHPPIDFSEIMEVTGRITSSPSSGRPDQIRDRSNSKLYDVKRKWFGFGTLAYPGFRDPGWSPGHLVYLGKVVSSNSTISDAFGFSWDGQEEEEGEGDASIVESTVLTWVDLQNEYMTS